MLNVIGLWHDRTDLPDTETYLRELRKGTRLDRLQSLGDRGDEEEVAQP